MADSDHVAAATDLEIEVDPDTGRRSGTVPGTGPDAVTASLSRLAEVHEGFEPTSISEFQHESHYVRVRAAPSESDLHESVLHPHARYPLNSKR